MPGLRKDAGSACLFEHLLCADDIERIAVAGIPVSDDRDIDRMADAGQLLCHFRAGKKADIRLSETGRGDGVSAHGKGRDARHLCDLGAQRITDARGDHNVSGFQVFTESDTFFSGSFHDFHNGFLLGMIDDRK